MREHRNIVVAAGKHGRKILLGAFCGMALLSCMSQAPAMLNDRKAAISGRGTVGMSSSDATRIMLTRAARMTLDHGFRYFQIAGSRTAASIRDGMFSIQPGANIMINVYREGEINQRGQAVWDAENIAAGGRIKPSVSNQHSRASHAWP